MEPITGRVGEADGAGAGQRRGQGQGAAAGLGQGAAAGLGQGAAARQGAGEAAGADEVDTAYLTALTDWLACASAGADERASRAARACGDDLLADVAFLGTAGHVLDFDDTFAEGIAHVSAACAPAALALAAHLGLTLGAALEAYAEGFEAMAAVAAASHPALYDAGWHPTAVCGPVGAAVAASSLMDLSSEQRQTAVSLALLRVGGARGVFGSDGKAIQVGLAAAAGVQGALLARAGASVEPRAIQGPPGHDALRGAIATGASAHQSPAGGRPAIERNWIKLHPSCLGTHSPIDLAAQARRGGGRLEQRLEVIVHPLARQAAHLDEVSDGLSAKFSIPYCVAFTFAHGPPRVDDFARVDPAVGERARLVKVVIDGSLPQFGAVLSAAGKELGRVGCPRGAPERPVSASELAEKVATLAGGDLRAVLADTGAPAVDVLAAAGLGGIARRGPRDP